MPINMFKNTVVFADEGIGDIRLRVALLSRGAFKLDLTECVTRYAHGEP